MCCQHQIFFLVLFYFTLKVTSGACAKVAVEGWTFPKQKIRIVLPEDYPLNVPFYRLVVVPNKKDQITDIRYSMKVTPYRKSYNETSALTEQFVQLDRETGFLTLIKNFSKPENRVRRRHRTFVNITFTGISKKDKLSRKFQILMEFNDTVASYCIPKFSTCFPSKPAYVYHVPEDSKSNVVLDYLMNPGLPVLCPNVSLQYSLPSDQNLLSVNTTSGALQLMSEVDAEVLPSSNLTVKCTAGNNDFEMSGAIFFTDVNDNGPTTQSGNSSEQLIYHLKPDQKFQKITVSVYDKDSKHLNRMDVRIENDTQNLFKVQQLREYENVPKHIRHLIFADIESVDLLQHPFTEYNFSVVMEDTALQKKERKVVFDISLIRESFENIEFQDIYEVNISRKATDYAKILQLSAIPLNNFRFSLANWRKNKDWLNITDQSGIVFIRNSLLMTNRSTEQRKITWWKRNGTHEVSGTSRLIINIDEAGTSDSCSATWWCSYYGSREECQENCGKGSRTGKCTWRQEPLTTDAPTTEYSACSPDLSTCPDGHCDELEQREPTLCPLDCAKQAIGTASLSANGIGVEKARGTCICSTVIRCSCMPPPAEIRLLRDHEGTNRSIIEIKNITVVDAVKRYFYDDDETSTSVDIIPIEGFLTDGSCGIGCVVLASIAPCAIVVLIVTIFTVRRIKGNHVNLLKIGGSRISLSAVPSDYVQERPNSVQDSRTTTSETSSAGKTVLDPKWEFPRNRLQFQTILGEGEFGKVVKAQASNIAGIKGLTTVAVKMLKENGGHEEMQDLISEFTLLKDISHPNVIKLLGACTEKGGPFYLIVEYAEMGSLRSHLRKRRKHNNCCKHNATYGLQDINAQPPREYYQFMCERSRYEPRHCYFHKEQLSYAWQIAKGMAYLSDMKLIHRDLAARNILLNKKKVAKISDFGLSRDIYKGEAYLKKTKGRVPVKWLALESLEDQIYTSKSDVWSFGIVMWEIMMQGATPYPGVTPQRLFNLLKAGYRMSKPEFCPDELYVIMRLCWNKTPNERPSFKELVHKLESLLNDTVDYMDFGNRAVKSGGSTEEPLMSFYDPSSSTIQYTSVFVDNAEECYDRESLENIGLDNLFGEGDKDAPKTSSDRESIA